MWRPPATVTVEVTVGRHSRRAARGGPTGCEVTDAAIDLPARLLPRPRGLAEAQLPTGQRRVVSGKVELFDGIAQMVHPDHILRPEEAGEIPAFEPVYPLTGA
jgi:ATP-dependent DNA helicase RecG